jgi:hypothetical protein
MSFVWYHSMKKSSTSVSEGVAEEMGGESGEGIDGEISAMRGLVGGDMGAETIGEFGEVFV